MKFDTYFRMTSYAMIASAFLALTLTGELDALSVALYSFALAACFYIDTKGITKWRLKEWMWRGLTGLYIPFMFFDAVVLSDKVIALVHLSLFASAAKLYQNKTDRDWVFLYLVAFFQMLLAAGLTFNTTFVISLVAFLFFFISALAAFEIRRTQRSVASVQEEVITRVSTVSGKSAKPDNRLDNAAPRRVQRIRYLVVASLIQAVVIVLLTLPFFFMIPRFSSANIGSGFGETAPMTGFSDTVELGQVANIKATHRVVMRIRLDRKPNKYLRWRGKILEHYDGKSWSLPETADRMSEQRQFRSSSGEERQNDASFRRSFTFDSPQGEPQELITQEIILEPLSTNIIFATKMVTNVVAELPDIRFDKYTGALMASGLRGRTSYTAKSNITIPTAAELRAASGEPYAPEISRTYLQKPSAKDRAPFDPRIRRLAQEVTASARTNYDKAKAIESYLKTEFSYTLNLTMSSPDPLAEFLFETKEGHCEYFATAMVMLLRSIDIPARIVNGFQMGEYNDLNNLYVVRESDAHSWVEVYFPAQEIKGASASPATLTPKPPAINGHWVEFDPTPPAGINDYSQGGITASLRKYMDAMEVFWLDYVVTLDREEQASILVEVQQQLVSLKNTALRYYKTMKDWVKSKVDALLDVGSWTLANTLWVIGGFCAVAFFGFTLYVILAYRKRQRRLPTGYNPWWYRLFIAPILRKLNHKKRDHQASAVLFYEQMLAIAARAGLVKQPEQTPLEFAATARFPAIGEITRVYNRVRFGSATLEESEARRVSELLTELKQAVAGK